MAFRKKFRYKTFFGESSLRPTGEGGKGGTMQSGKCASSFSYNHSQSFIFRTTFKFIGCVSIEYCTYVKEKNPFLTISGFDTIIDKSSMLVNVPCVTSLQFTFSINGLFDTGVTALLLTSLGATDDIFACETLALFGILFSSGSSGYLTTGGSSTLELLSICSGSIPEGTSILCISSLTSLLGLLSILS